MFRTVPLSIIRSFSLYTQEWYMSYRFADSMRAGSGRNWLQFHPDTYISETFLILQVTEVDFHRNVVFQQNGSPPHFNENVPHILIFVPRSANRASCSNFVAASIGRHTVGLLLLELFVPVSASKSNVPHPSVSSWYSQMYICRSCHRASVQGTHSINFSPPPQ